MQVSLVRNASYGQHTPFQRHTAGTPVQRARSLLVRSAQVTGLQLSCSGVAHVSPFPVQPFQTKVRVFTGGNDRAVSRRLPDLWRQQRL